MEENEGVRDRGRGQKKGGRGRCCLSDWISVCTGLAFSARGNAAERRTGRREARGRGGGRDRSGTCFMGSAGPFPSLLPSLSFFSLFLSQCPLGAPSTNERTNERPIVGRLCTRLVIKLSVCPRSRSNREQDRAYVHVRRTYKRESRFLLIVRRPYATTTMTTTS